MSDYSAVIQSFLFQHAELNKGLNPWTCTSVSASRLRGLSLTTQLLGGTGTGDLGLNRT